MSYKTYYYDKQIRSYILQFMDIFVGLRVRTGMRNGEPLDIKVPVIYGSSDRVAAYIIGGEDCVDGQQVSLPIMAANMTALSLRPESNRHPAIQDRRTYITVDDSIEASTPEEQASKIRTKVRTMPVAYTLTMELSFATSNTDQQLQILEQILMLFNPSLDIQTTDSAWDWTSLTKVTLTDISLEVDYPTAEMERVVGGTLTFEIPIWIPGPMKETINSFVGAVRVQFRDAAEILEDLDDLVITEPQAIPQGITQDNREIPLIGGDDEPANSRVDVSEDEDGIDSGTVLPEDDIDTP